MLTLNGSGLLQQALGGLAADSGNLPPSNIAPPELVGKAEVGATVSARPGVWAGLPVPKVRTTLFVSGAARRSPCLLGPEDDGKEIIVTDLASNDAGEAAVSSSRDLVRHSVPHALGVPESVSIGTKDETVVVDSGAFFVGTSGGQWSAKCLAGADSLQLDIDEMGRLTLGPGSMSGSLIVSVSYANSGGSSSAIFTVFSGNMAPVEGPVYDGSLGDLSITSGEPVVIDAGIAFSGNDLAFSATGLPKGLATDSDTGRISGEATQVGSYSVTVIATNPSGSANAAFEIDIMEELQPLPDAPSYYGSLEAQQITLGGTFEFSAGDAFSGENLTFSAAGIAPGLAIDAATGRISGKPSTVGDFTIEITASNEGGEASGSFPFLVTEPTVSAPVYDGGLTSRSAENNTAAQTYAMAPFFSNTASGTWSIVVTPDIAGIAIDASTGVITYEPLLLLVGMWAVEVTVDVGGQSATSSFDITITPVQVVSSNPVGLEPLDYDGKAPATLRAGGLPYNFSQHISGAGTITYSANGLPAGTSINASSGVINGTFTGIASATITASNGATPDVTAGISFDATLTGGDGGEKNGSTTITSTDMVSETNSATLSIGADEPGRVVYVSVMVGGTDDAALAVTGGTVTLIATDGSFVNRAASIYKVEGLTGTTAAMTWGGDTEYVAVFKVIGYQAIATNPWQTGRRTGTDTTAFSISGDVPIGGAVLLHGKKFNQFDAAPAGTVIDEATNGLRGYWENGTGTVASSIFTFGISVADNEKYAGALIMELI